MSDSRKVLAHVYSKSIKMAQGDTGVARSFMYWTPELGQHKVTLPGPRCRVWLHGARMFRVTDTGQLQVHTHMNNPMAVHKAWQNLYPAWGKISVGGIEMEVLTAILDERGGKIKFSMVDDIMEG